MTFEDKLEAAHDWIDDFISISTSEVENHFENGCYDFLEVTPYNEDDEEPEDAFPAWDTMWAFKNSLDKEWAKENLEEIKNCGFRSYQSEEYGIVIGIGGYGYDFMTAHFILLLSNVFIVSSARLTVIGQIVQNTFML